MQTEPFEEMVHAFIILNPEGIMTTHHNAVQPTDVGVLRSNQMLLNSNVEKSIIVSIAHEISFVGSPLNTPVGLMAKYR